MLRKLYVAAKFRLNVWAQRMVNWSHGVFDRSTGIRNDQLRRFVQAFAANTGGLGKFMLQFPRVDVFRFNGSLGSIVFVGDTTITKIRFFEKFFPEGYEVTEMGRVKVWSLPRLANMWMKDNDLVICEVSDFFPWRIRALYAFDNPRSVQQILTLDKSFDDLLAGGEMKRLRHRINRMQKHGYTLRVSNSAAELDYFYHKMYVPTMQQRHKERVIIHPYTHIEQVFQKGFLTFLSLDGKDVGGDLSYIKDGAFYNHYTGMLDGDTELLDQDISIASYANLIQFAIKQGAKEINFLDSLAWVSDGIFRHKQLWGAKPRRNPYGHHKLLFRANRLSPAWRDRLNEIGFITRRQDKYLRIYIDEAVPSLEAAHKSALGDGLDGIQIVMSGRSQNEVGIALPQLSA